MSKVMIDEMVMRDISLHKNCELQLRDSPFGDGLVLYCLDHNMVILEVENEKTLY